MTKWLPEALADLERLHGFLAERNPDAARRAAQAVLSGSELLTANPRAGRPMPDDTGRREWIVPFGTGGYVLRYRLHGSVPVVLRVWHGLEFRSP